MSDKKNKKREDLLKEVLELIEEHNVTAYEIEQNTSLSAVGVQKIINGDTKRPLTRTLEDITSYIKNKHTQNDHPPKEEPTFYKSETNTKGSPLIPIEAVAGFGTGDNAGIKYEDCDHYIIPEFDARGMDFLIRVSGSSMYPKYSNGDVLACKKIHEITFFQWGKIYVIDSNQGALVKRLFEDKDNTENVICVSDNKENYPPFPLPKEEIRSLSIVLGVVRME